MNRLERVSSPVGPFVHRVLAGALAFVVALGPLSAAPAHADASSNKAAAQVLFDEGRRLMGEGKFSDACPKLAESQRLDPGLGTQFNLSDCYERLGRTASAWAGFLEVAAAARAAGQSEREQVARQRAAALEQQLSKLTIVVSPKVAATPGLEVRRDGELVGAPLFGVAVPVDPGPHPIVATATGRAPFNTTIDVRPDHRSETVSVPELAPQAEEPSAVAAAPAVTAAGLQPAAATSPGSHPDGAAQRRLAWIVGGVGVAAFGVSGVFALQAKHQYNQSLPDCRSDNPNLCNSQGLSKREDARNAGNIASVTLGIGVLALGVAAFEWLTAPSSPPSIDTSAPRASRSVDLAGSIGPSGSSVSVRGIW